MGKTRQSANLVSDNNIFVNITNDRVGIGSVTPKVKLDVIGDANISGVITASSFSGSATAATYATTAGIATYATTAGIATNAQGLTGTPSITVQNATVQGNLTVNGTQTVINTQTLDVADKTIGIGSTSSPSDSLADGSGIIVYGTTNKSLLWYNTNKNWGLVGGGLSVTSGNVLVGSATSTGTTSQPLQVTGGAYVSANTGIGTTNPTSRLHIVGGDTRFNGVTETVSAATTYMSGTAMVLEMDVRQATTYTYTIPTGANIGIVSFKNVPAQTNNSSGTTVTLIATQNSAGTGNTTVTTGIGTNCYIVGYENGAAVAGISTRALVGSATTVTLSTTGSDRDFISFFIHYTGGTNTTASSYQVYATKNGGFRQGTIGV